MYAVEAVLDGYQKLKQEQNLQRIHAIRGGCF